MTNNELLSASIADVLIAALSDEAGWKTILPTRNGTKYRRADRLMWQTLAGENSPALWDLWDSAVPLVNERSVTRKRMILNVIRCLLLPDTFSPEVYETIIGGWQSAFRKENNDQTTNHNQ